MDEPQLPPGVPSRGPDLGDDPERAEQDGLALLERTGDEIRRGVGEALPEWAVAQTARILDAWTRQADEAVSTDDRRAILERARAAGEDAASRIGAELDELLSTDPDEQRVTPMQVVRTAVREVTAVLRDAGIPPVERDEFEEHRLPDDDYGITPRSLADLGDEDLAPLHLAWGVAKATVHKARHA